MESTLTFLISLTSTLQNLISRMDQPSTSNVQLASSSTLPSQPQNDLSIPSPPSMEEHPHPSIREQHDLNDAIDIEQERMDHLRESILHKELEKALKVKVEETFADEGVVEGSWPPKTEKGRNFYKGRQTKDYNLDCSVEFWVGHKFRSREAVLQGVKNYSIWRSAEYQVIESDRLKYHVQCHQADNGCQWSLCVALRQNLGYW
ncbi:hypothetical protein Ahy_B04g071944 [Arachis hypogaea]|uniref:Transposase MuDR plant domain-containing protein n=1 Tax=Arachis hypogaea TaxID=3818 RepID=A0A444ZM22_ARAHY|nr:hypothetical protein Ahy_B04g071944 [Arachis hypogaea]